MTRRPVQQQLTTQLDREQSLAMVAMVEALNEEAKTLALNLALTLAKLKAEMEPTHASFGRLEPEFMRLVSGTVQVVSELNHLINAARNLEVMAYEPPSGQVAVSQLELRLRAIAEQASALITSLKSASER